MNLQFTDNDSKKIRIISSTLLVHLKPYFKKKLHEHLISAIAISRFLEKIPYIGNLHHSDPT